MKTLLAVLLVVCGGAAFGADAWWNKEWRYRTAVTVDSGMYERTDYLVRMPLDLKKPATDQKIAGGLDPASLRVVEVIEDGSAREIPSTFVKSKDFAAGAKEDGTLVWVMAGKTGTMTARKFHVYADTPASKKAAPSYPPIPGANEEVGVNLVPNGGFEEMDKNNQPVGWSTINFSDKTVGVGEVTTKEAHSGKSSLHIGKPTLEGGSYMYGLGGWSAPIAVKPGRKYRLTCWMKAAGTGSQCSQMCFLDEKGNYTKPPVYVMPGGIGTHDWMKYSDVAACPAGASKLHVQVHTHQAKGDFWYDDVEIVEIPTEQPAAMTVGALETLK